MSPDQKFVIEQQWRARAASLGLKPKTVKHARAEVAFFCGAIAAINALFPNEDGPDQLSPAVPPIWVLNIMSGRPVAEVAA